MGRNLTTVELSYHLLNGWERIAHGSLLLTSEAVLRRDALQSSPERTQSNILVDQLFEIGSPERKDVFPEDSCL